ncbi:unnamed protein product [Rhizoctonia solani]|uniref:Laminin domain protein n=1 Tax=Rhizoctonia solani TaxID=456999 RepID=A0A8H3BF51_9AGAM|nr:unnamed protein product [Rhizoctonia solani]
MGLLGSGYKDTSDTPETPQSLLTNEYTYTPPSLPNHLASTYNLKPIVGHPSHDEVKTIHAAIRAVNVEAQVPHLYNPELSLQLSQHLFSVQMAIYRKAYPLSLFPADNVCTAPSLLAHIPIELEPVVGTPSNELLKAAQNAIGISESLRISPLFDPDLSIQLSQHLFNLQFARYIQDLAHDQFISKSGKPQRTPQTAPEAQVNSPVPCETAAIHSQSSCVMPTESAQIDPLEVGASQPSVVELNNLGHCALSEITQLEDVIKDIRELTSESKGILESINRVLIATQRTQVIAGEWNNGTYAHLHPVNQQGITAAEFGLPQIRYFYYQGNYHLHLSDAQCAGYLAFFQIGTDLIEGDRDPQLKAGKRDEADQLIFKYLGLVY